MVVVTQQHGFDAAAAAEVVLHPEQKEVWNRRRDGLKQMRTQGNDQEVRLLSIEKVVEDIKHRPF